MTWSDLDNLSLCDLLPVCQRINDNLGKHIYKPTEGLEQHTKLVVAA